LTTAKQFRIEVARERFKFSCAHMTLFPDGTKERLHGHNFYLSCSLVLSEASFERLVSFSLIKDALGAICTAWKERTLLPGRNPLLKIVRDADGEVEFTACGERYVLPKDDVLILPIDNITVEGLASVAADRIWGELSSSVPMGVVCSLTATVREAPGQGASCTLSF